MTHLPLASPPSIAALLFFTMDHQAYAVPAPSSSKEAAAHAKKVEPDPANILEAEEEEGVVPPTKP